MVLLTMETLLVLFTTTSINLGLPAGLLQSVCWVESRHNIHAINKDDGTSSSLGICQIKHKTAKYMGFKGSEKELMNPKTNIYYAGKYLKYQLKRYHNDIPRALTAYNRGNARGLTKSKYSDKVIRKWRKK